ncbi:prolyl aminopeptidase [Pseudoalteromonas denitrificans]|uniref:Proline iminopeptidase n=1 Tax=Pseudoalteromonas denitrificans DSM 6059 TaxID=1123010 RepID=A0A1I1RME0_9GAMM|nr:prolyl aminopeptidase [Pseudoalteromonas denitrificans]SFD31580.1 proline iminopeptidase [Pseudoalteromonas denitrificans DSM 6059]
MPQLYGVGGARRSYHLAVGEGHQIHIEEYGCSDGIPVLICHGGPGSGLNPLNCRYFNPEHYRLILFSQRGCGLSTPHFELQANTTQHLLADMEQIRNSLGISLWVITGESWGATLALLYAITYPEKVSGLLLRSTFLARKADINWLFGEHGAPAQSFPEHFESFRTGYKSVSETLQYYKKQLSSEDEFACIKAAKAWCEWESVLSGMYPNHIADLRLITKEKVLDVARLENHYFTHDFFIEDEYIANKVDKLLDVPMWFLHGRQDLISPFAGVYHLTKKLEANPNIKLDILNDVGHSSENVNYANAIRIASDMFYCLMKKRFKIR